MFLPSRSSLTGETYTNTTMARCLTRMIQNIQKGTSRCIRNYNLFGAAGMKGGEDSILDAVYVT